MLSIADLLIVCSRRADAVPTSWITTYTPRPFMMAEVWMQPSGSSEATSCLRNTFGTIDFAPLVLVVKSLCFVNSLRICIFAGCAFGSGLQGWLSVVSQQSPSLCLSCCTRIWLLQCVPMLHHSKRSALQHSHASVDGFLSFEVVVGGAVELHRIALPSINSV